MATSTSTTRSIPLLSFNCPSTRFKQRCRTQRTLMMPSALAMYLVDALAIVMDSDDVIRLLNWRKGGPAPVPTPIISQRSQLDDMLQKQGVKVNKVLNFAIDDAILEERITSRWIHLPCGCSYYTKFAPPEVPGIDDIMDLKSKFLAYKDRAHAFLQKKDAEISSAKDSELFKAQEEALNEAERDLAVALAERDKAIQDLHDVLAKYDKELAARDAALNDADQRISSLTAKLNSANTHFLSEKETWQKNLESIEQSWKLKYGALEAQNNGHVNDSLQKDLEELNQQYKKLKEEHDVFRDIADRTIEEKEKEIAKLLEDNKNLHRSLELRPSVDYSDNKKTDSVKQDAQSLDIAAAEQQILLLARQQAQREEELAQSQRHILALQDEIEELEHENRLHSQQEAMLKAELRNMERSQKREGVDMTYLKNVILKLLETGEVEALLPVVGMLLQFSPEEIRKCQQAYRSSNDISNPAAPLADGASTPSSLFSRFSFS